jgi:O-antigen/teichoic acid export membrane protein
LDNGPEGIDPGAGRAANRQQIRGSSLLLVGRMIGLGLDFVAQVLIVRYLEKTEYGAFALALSIVALGATACLLGLERTVGRFAPIYQERGDIGRMWGTIVVVVATVATLGLAVVLGVYAFHGVLGGVVQNEVALSILLIMIVLSPLQALDSVLIALFATFGSARSIFFRRYVFAPVLQLSVVVVLVASGSGVHLLALGYVAAAAAGIAIYTVVLLRLLERQGLLRQFDRATLRLPVREIFAFSLPLLTTDVVFVLRSSLTVILLEVLRTTEEVADYRAVLPLAVQTLFVSTSFRFIFTPGASRLYAREDWHALNDLYWRTATWIALLSFPLFALCVAFGEPVAVLLFGEPYRAAGTVLSILCIGYYINGATGFNSLILRVFGRVRFMVGVDVLTAGISLMATVLLISRFGAIGAAIGTTMSFLTQKALYQWGLKTQTTVLAIDPNYVRPYVSIVVGVLVTLLLAVALRPPIALAFVLVGIVSLTILGINRQALQIMDTYPELGRFKLMRRIFGDQSTP